MKYSQLMQRLAGLGGAKWSIHSKCRAMAREGRDVIELTIGEPDVDPPEAMVESMIDAIRSGRTGYAEAQGEIRLRNALAGRYSATMGRSIGPDQVLCLPGTQTALYTAILGTCGPGDEVLVGDPQYATYHGVIQAAGAAMVPVPLKAENGFRLDAGDIAQRITPRSRVILLNTPHNPTGAVLRREDIRRIGDLALANDLWIVSDEVYEELIFDGPAFASPLAEPDLAERTIVVSSISKSHAAAGFRSGWAIASKQTIETLLPLAETILFGNQPFIADMTAEAVSRPSAVAETMRRSYRARADLLADRLAASKLRVHRPEAGMFAMIDIGATGVTADAYASDLLEAHGVAVMPGTSFGETLNAWVRVALTVPDEKLALACDRILEHAADLERKQSGKAAMTSFTRVRPTCLTTPSDNIGLQAETHEMKR